MVSDVDVVVTFGPISNGVNYITEASNDLKNWTEIDNFTPGADAESKTVSTILTPRRYIRVTGSR